MNADTARFDFVDIVRAVAVFGVIQTHLFFEPWSSRHIYWEVGDWVFYPFLFGHGWLGVNAFFVLSGFVLYRPDRLDRFDTPAFYRHRAWRLWPLYSIFLMFLLITKRRPLLESLETAVIALTGLQKLVPSTWMPANTLIIFWSLGIEILFSILLPVLILLIVKFGFFRVALPIIAFCFLYRIAADQVWWAEHAQYGNRLINPLKDNIVGRLDDFLIGMMGAELLHRGWRPSRRTLGVAAIALLAALYAWNVVHAVDHRALWVSLLASSGHLAFALPVMLGVVGLIGRPAWRWPVFAPLVVVGQASYSVYIMQSFLGFYWGRRLFGMGGWGIALYVALTILLSVFLFLTVELNGIRRKPRWARRLTRGFGD